MYLSTQAPVNSMNYNMFVPEKMCSLMKPCLTLIPTHCALVEITVFLRKVIHSQYYRHGLQAMTKVV